MEKKKKEKKAAGKEKKEAAKVTGARPLVEEQDFCCAEAPNGFLPKQERE